MNAANRLTRICLAQIAAGNTAWVTSLRDKALALIAAGKGQLCPLTTGGQNGKNYAALIVLTAVDVADITQSAIAEAAGTGSAEEGVTVPDFCA